MPKSAVEKLEAILIRAATDKKFRDALIKSPGQAISAAKINLSPKDLARLKTISSDLRRFAGNKKLHVDDARSWASGVLLTKLIRGKSKSWDVNVFTIMKRSLPLACTGSPTCPNFRGIRLNSTGGTDNTG